VPSLAAALPEIELFRVCEPTETHKEYEDQVNIM